MIRKENIYATETPGFVVIDVFSILCLAEKHSELDHAMKEHFHSMLGWSRSESKEFILKFKDSVIFRLFLSFRATNKVVSFDNNFGSLLAIYDRNPFCDKGTHASCLIFFGDLNVVLVHRVSTILRKRALVLTIEDEDHFLKSSSKWKLLEIKKTILN